MEAPICTVLLITYNHAPYVAKCIESILSQKTEFSFIIKIFDDASTDGSSEIIRDYAKQYPNLIEAHIATKNMGATENIWRAYCSVKTKYVTITETDDYWCNDNRLQKQISLLEQHKECSFCSSQTREVVLYDDFRKHEDGAFIVINNYILTHPIISLEDILSLPVGSGYYSHVSSRLIRTECLNLSKLKHREAILSDNNQFYYLLMSGNMCFLNELTSVYQATGKGICSGKNPFKRAELSTYCLFELNQETNYIIGKRITEEVIFYLRYAISIYEFNERAIKKQAKENRRINKINKKIKKIKRYVIPPFILDVFSIPRDIFRFFKRKKKSK